MYSYFAGCKIPYYLPEYGSSTLALLDRFDIELQDLEFKCCGYPVRDIDFQSFLLAGARNLALAEQQNTDIVTPCKCCFGSLKFVEYYLKQRESVFDQINAMLKPEGLQWQGRTQVKHLLTILHEDVGIDALRDAVVNPLAGIKVATHTGCHALRPGNVTMYDNPFVPGLFDDLVAVTGAESVFWSMSTECCGNPQWDKNRKIALKQMQRKLLNARQAGADFVCTACTYCQMHFEQNSQSDLIPLASDQFVPAILISQLIGLSIGIDEETLGIGEDIRNKIMVRA
ncbi:CoB--CoM heterodisulfide reductase subunit B (EC [Olavius algarvensis Delta 1 endosymbiont]|nr:CoB--CoM heterodisulfide reductase subunit B (EC [Olavius algarvensis Delta 1 endosymbiont]